MSAKKATSSHAVLAQQLSHVFPVLQTPSAAQTVAAFLRPRLPAGALTFVLYKMFCTFKSHTTQSINFNFAFSA